jgi:hypothetical protein
LKVPLYPIVGIAQEEINGNGTIQTGVYFFRIATTRCELFSKDFTLSNQFFLNGIFPRLLDESRRAMIEHKQNEWRVLCEKASSEQDFEKLLELTNEILRLTEPKRKRLQPQSDESNC